MITVVRYTASWCQPCKTLAPLFQKLAEKYAGRVTFKTVDVDEDRTSAEKNAIRNVPSVLFFENDEPSGRLVGVKPQQDYIDAIELRLKVEAEMNKYD